MITALVLVCNLDGATMCYTTMYSRLFATAEECRAVIQYNKLQEIFKTTINGIPYDIYDYRCVDWNSGNI